MLTSKMKLYAQARLSGLNQTQSAIAAGYSEKTATPAASRLEKDPDVRAHMERLRAGALQAGEEMEPNKQPTTRATKPAAPPDRALIEATDPLDFMLKMVADVTEDPKLRLEAAKAAIPYLYAKKGEVGKKEEKAKAAEKVREGRFGLRSVK